MGILFLEIIFVRSRKAKCAASSETGFLKVSCLRTRLYALSLLRVDTPDFALRVCRYNNVMGGRMEKLAEGMPKAA